MQVSQTIGTTESVWLVASLRKQVNLRFLSGAQEGETHVAPSFWLETDQPGFPIIPVHSTTGRNSGGPT